MRGFGGVITFYIKGTNLILKVILIKLKNSQKA